MLADGSVKTCSAEEDPDLFHAVPWSYGTLGFLVSVEIEIIPSKRFIKLDYWPVYSMDQMVETFEKEVESGDAADFVECLVYSPDKVGIFHSIEKLRDISPTGRGDDGQPGGQLRAG